MAEGYLRHLANEKVEIYSAGIETHGVNPRAIAIMLEDGIDISNHTSNNIAEYDHVDFDFVITVCDNANENCPFFASKAERFHHNFPDPGKTTGSETQVMESFRTVRGMIKDYCNHFVAQHL